MPQLPLFIKEDGDSALIWIDSQDALQEQLSLSRSACLLDSSQSFWTWQDEQLIQQESLPSLGEINRWIQQWATQLNQCCSTKLQVRSLADALEAVEYLDQF